jgi:hypothetical protein
MSTAAIAYGGVAIVAIGLALALVKVLKPWAVVAAVSATVTAVLYQVYVYVDLGHYDPFTPIAFTMSWLYAFVLAAVAVVVVRKLRGDGGKEASRSDVT